MDFEHLRRLFSAYFHQDWIHVAESDDWRITAQSYVKDVSSSDLAATVRDLQELLHTSKDDATLRRRVLEDMYCCYYPGDGGLDMTDWLIDLLAYLQMAQNNR